jgi:hypothetical protein
LAAIFSQVLCRFTPQAIGTIKYYFSRDIIDQIIQYVFYVFGNGLDTRRFQTTSDIADFTQFISILFAMAIATIIFFFYSLIISFMAFWSEISLGFKISLWGSYRHSL